LWTGHHLAWVILDSNPSADHGLFGVNLYTTNSSESLNYHLRKIIKRPGNLSNEAVVKLLWPGDPWY
jgi:hypothetical protein